jgi:hypothetical protein
MPKVMVSFQASPSATTRQVAPSFNLPAHAVSKQPTTISKIAFFILKAQGCIDMPSHFLT